MQEDIFELKSVTTACVEQINSLLAQLSSSPIVFTDKELGDIVSSPNSHLFVLCVDGAMVGMLTLCSYLAPTGRKWWIEDVVVDSAMRGKAYGRRLVQHAVEYASNEGAGTLMLTSKPARVAANALYRSVGFLPKETNLYRMALPRTEE